MQTYICPHIARPLVVDGRVTKREWQAVPPVWFVPATGQPPERVPYHATTFRACWTDDRLYLAFECIDADIWGTFADRDADLFDEEVVEAFLCPTGDLRRYYEFEWSPRDVVFDASVWSPDLNRRTMEVDRGWDCHCMVSAVSTQGTVHLTAPRPGEPERGLDGEGWSVEVAVPFAAFPEAGAPKPGTDWRANFYRIDRRGAGEFTAWSPTMEDPPNFHVPPRFGVLRFAG